MLPLWKTQIICYFWKALSCSFNYNTGLDFSPHLLNIAAFSSFSILCLELHPWLVHIYFVSSIISNNIILKEDLN